MNKLATSNRKVVPAKLFIRLILLGLTSGVVFFNAPLQAIALETSAPVWRVDGGDHVMLAVAAEKTAQKPTGDQVRRPSSDFDHLLTGFPLFGAHSIVECGDCHQHGILRGTPTRCELCHGNPGQRASSFKPLNHVTTSEPCDQCHNENTWAGSKFDHSAIAPTTCTQCHGTGTAPGMPSGHMVTALPCDSCHRTTGWIPARFKHANVAPGSCGDCHGVTATGIPGGHVPVPPPPESCDACHVFGTWLGAKYNHAGVVAGSCLTCHGVTAVGLPGGHIPASMSCDFCHDTSTFTTSTMINHSSSQGVIPGGCLTCHNGAYTSQGAKTLTSGHIPAPMSCDACHGTTRFSTSTMKNHDVSQGVVPGGCLTCHNGAYTSQGARGLPSGHKPSSVTTCDGSGCHNTNGWGD